MSQNPMPTANDELFAQASDLIGGLLKHQVALGMKHHPAEAVAKDLELARSSQAKFHDNLAQTAKVLKPRLASADDDGRKFILAARSVLGNFLGTKWSDAWYGTGFLNNSTRMPKNGGGREALLGSLAGYFAAHPEMEVPALGVTAARGRIVHAALQRAIDDLQNQTAAAVTLRENRQKAIAALRRRVSGVKTELHMLLDKNSPTWLAFGLKIPGLRPVRAKKGAEAKPAKSGAVVALEPGQAAA